MSPCSSRRSCRSWLVTLAAVAVALSACTSSGSGNTSGSNTAASHNYLDGQPVPRSSGPNSGGPNYDFAPLADLQDVVKDSPEAVVTNYDSIPQDLQNIPIEQRAIQQTVRHIDANEPVQFLSGTIYSVPPALVDSSQPTGPGTIRDENEFLAKSVNPIVYLERHKGQVTATLLTHQQVPTSWPHPVGQYGSEDGYFTYVTPLRRPNSGPLEGNSLWKARTFSGNCQPAEIRADCLYFEPTQYEASYQGNDHVIINGRASIYVGGDQYELVFPLAVADDSTLIPVADDRSTPFDAPYSPEGTVITELKVMQLRSNNTSAIGANDLLARVPLYSRP